MTPTSKIPNLTPRPCTRCSIDIPTGADYFRFDLGDKLQRVCLKCFGELGGKDGN